MRRKNLKSKVCAKCRYCFSGVYIPVLMHMIKPFAVTRVSIKVVAADGLN